MLHIKKIQYGGILSTTPWDDATLPKHCLYCIEDAVPKIYHSFIAIMQQKHLFIFNGELEG